MVYDDNDYVKIAKVVEYEDTNIRRRVKDENM
jgi:hypothetical protein